MIRLSDDDHGLLPDVILDVMNGARVSHWDPGFPSVRDVSEPYVQASGNRDTSLYHGSSLATLRLMVIGNATESRRDFLDRFMAHCVPSARSYVHWKLNDETVERCVQFRIQKVTSPIQKHNRILVGCSMVVPLGIMQSSVVQTVVIDPAGSGTELGRAYDLDFDRDYPASDPLGAKIVVNDGNVTAWPRIRIVGPVTNPRILNNTTGREYEFIGLTLTGGQFIDIDTFDRDIVNQANVSQMDKLDITVSTWWGLEPGDNELLFEPDTSTFGTSKLHVVYRHAWL